MAKKDEYYSNDYGQRRKQKTHRSLGMRLVDILLTLISIATGAALVLTWIIPHVHPEKLWVLSVVGLAAPVIYLVTLVLTFYWIIRWRKVRALIMLALAVVGFFKVSLFYKIDFSRRYDNADSLAIRHAFKVMTYNVRDFSKVGGGNMTDSVLQLVLQQDPAIVCFQEFNSPKAESAPEFEALKQRYNFALPNGKNIADSLHGKYGMVILSKFPVLQAGTALTAASAIWANVLIGSDTVRVLNAHLHTTDIKIEDDKYLDNLAYLADEEREDKLRSIILRLRDNNVLRAGQVDSLNDFMRPWRGHSIVCGDFNDTPVSYTYRRMSKALGDAFSEAGRGYSYTYRGFFNMLRIDYIFSCERFEAVSYDVLPVDYSDHMPVVVSLK